MIGAAIVPMALSCAALLWFFLVLRPSRQEHWGDGAILFYVAGVAYPTSLILILAGCVGLFRQGREIVRARLRMTVALLSAAGFSLIAPWLLVPILASV